MPNVGFPIGCMTVVRRRGVVWLFGFWLFGFCLCLCLCLSSVYSTQYSILRGGLVFLFFCYISNSIILTCPKKIKRLLRSWLLPAKCRPHLPQHATTRNNVQVFSRALSRALLLLLPSPDCNTSRAPAKLAIHVSLP